MKLEVGKKYKSKWGVVYEVQSEHTVYQLKQEGGYSGRTSEHDTNDFTPFVEPKFKKGDLVVLCDLADPRRIDRVTDHEYEVSVFVQRPKPGFSRGRMFDMSYLHDNAVKIGVSV